LEDVEEPLEDVVQGVEELFDDVVQGVELEL
jgi:hypothetical protein